MINSITINKNLDIESIETILGKNDEVMIYGYSDFFYWDIGLKIKDLIENSLTSIKKVYDWQIGDDRLDHTTFEGREVEKLLFEEGFKEVLEEDPTTAEERKKDNIRRKCKTAITNIVLENYKRIKEGKNPIVILFCVDLDETENPIFDFSSKHLYDPEKIAEKTHSHHPITRSELRRCYKLCVELTSSPHKELREMAEVAIRTIKFVKLYRKGHSPALIEVAPFWNHKKCTEAMQKRQDFRKKQEKYVELERDARILEKEADKLLKKIDLTRKEKNEALKVRRAATKARREADNFFNKISKENMGLKKSDYFRMQKSEKYQWRLELLKSAQNFDNQFKEKTKIAEEEVSETKENLEEKKVKEMPLLEEDFVLLEKPNKEDLSTEIAAKKEVKRNIFSKFISKIFS